MDRNDIIEELKTTLARDGLHSAIASLNARTECRFTSMYRFDGKMLRNLTFYDRANAAAEPPEDIPVEASYCVYVRDLHRPFHVEDSLEDIRVGKHPKCREIRSYYGVPLEDSDGVVFGTLCHFDVNPVPISAENIALMEEFAKVVGRSGIAGRG